MKCQILFCVIALAFPTLALADQEPPAQAPEIAPSEVDHSLQELNDRLTEARAVPYFENGQPAGYRKVDDSAGEQKPQRDYQIISTGVLSNQRVELRQDHEEITVNKQPDQEPQQ